MKRIFLFLAVLMSVSHANSVLDGAWNGKPFDSKTLEDGVKRNHPAALAEWAYCSYYTLGGIRYDDALIVERSRAAAAKKSPLGLFMLGHCLLQTGATEEELAEAKPALEASLKMGHPLASWKYAWLRQSGKFGYEKRPAESFPLLEKAISEGAVMPLQTMSSVLRNGSWGKTDYAKAAEYAKRCFEADQPFGATEIFTVAYHPPMREKMGKFFTEKEFRLAEKRVREAADLGSPLALNVYGYYLVRHGRPHEGMPYLIRYSNGRRGSFDNLLVFNRMGNVQDENKGIKPIETDVQAQFKAARIGYQRQNLTANQKVDYAIMILEKSAKKAAPKEAEAIEILEEIIQDNPRHWTRAGFALGHFLAKLHLRGRDDSGAQFRRGMAHFEQFARYSSALHWIGLYYDHAKPPHRNIPKAIAALERAMEKSHGAFLRKQKEVHAKLMKEATDEQKAEAEALVADEWPWARKHRVQAFKYLQEIGDIPDGESFDKE